MALQVTSDNWEEKLDTTIPGTQERYLLGEFVNPFVIIAIASDSANPIWNKAGEVAQAIDTAVGKAYGQKQELFLRDLNLVNSTALTSGGYELWYFPLDRLAQTKIKVYEYQGETVDSQIQVLVSGLEQSNFLTEDLTGIGAKIDNILFKQQELSTSYTTSTSKIENALWEILDCLKPPEPPEPPTKNYLELRILQLI